MNQDVAPTPRTPDTTLSEDSSPSSGQTSPSYDTEEETTSDNESIVSTTSDRQLRPCAPISYNETVFKAFTWRTSGQRTQQCIHTTSK